MLPSDSTTSNDFYFVIFLVKAWTKLFDGYCEEGDARSKLADSTNSLTHCQSLCNGDCKFVSYATQGGNICYGSTSCVNGGDNPWKYVTYMDVTAMGSMKYQFPTVSSNDISIIDTPNSNIFVI